MRIHYDKLSLSMMNADLTVIHWGFMVSWICLRANRQPTPSRFPKTLPSANLRGFMAVQWEEFVGHKHNNYNN